MACLYKGCIFISLLWHLYIETKLCRLCWFCKSIIKLNQSLNKFHQAKFPANEHNRKLVKKYTGHTGCSRKIKRFYWFLEILCNTLWCEISQDQFDVTGIDTRQDYCNFLPLGEVTLELFTFSWSDIGTFYL